MPVSPDRARLLAKALLEIYQDAETQLLIKVAKRLAVGIDEPPWADRQLLAVQQLRLDTRQLLILLETKGLEALSDAILMAYNRGVALAGTDLMATGNHAAIAFGGVNTDAVRTLVTEGQRALRAMTLPIQSAQSAIYSDVVAQTATRMLTGTVTRREASAQALATWARKGITGFTDRGGRSWDMASYAEMVGRTTAGNAIVQGHVDRLVDNGHDLVIVSDVPAECSYCLVPGTRVEGPTPMGRTRLEYTGDVVRILTASGKDLTGTPDHAVLTPLGWRPLKDLRPGDQVISNVRPQGFAGVVPDDVQVPTRIEEAGESRVPVLLAGPARRELNGDGAKREVRAILPNGYLLSERSTSFSEPLRDLLLVGGIRTGSTFAGPSDLLLPLGGEWDAPVGFVRGGRPGGTLFGSGVGPALVQSSRRVGRELLVGAGLAVGGDPEGSRSGLNAGSAKVVGDAAPADTECCSDGLGVLAGDVASDQFGDLCLSELSEPFPGGPASNATLRQDLLEPGMADLELGHQLHDLLAGEVAADEIVSVDVFRNPSGHVWDLTTEPSWFVANGIVTHNCRPFEGKLLSLTGASQVGQRGDFQIVGTLAQAKAEGFMHPGCRHTLNRFIPGVTRPMHNTADPEGDKLRQQQRYRERRIRALKREVEAVKELDPEAAKKARAKLRAYTQDYRSWIEENGLKRLPYRESLKAR